jgi:hypothetical protein
VIPALSLRRGAWLLSGSYAAAPRYAFELRDRFYTGKRSEWDLAVGYYFAPSAAVTLGWKSILQNFEGPDDNYRYRGLTLGFAGSARITAGASLYGNAAIGVPGLFRAQLAEQTRDALGQRDFDQSYYVTEIGLAYPAGPRRAGFAQGAGGLGGLPQPGGVDQAVPHRARWRHLVPPPRCRTTRTAWCSGSAPRSDRLARCATTEPHEAGPVMRVSQRAAGMPAQPLALHAADVAEVDRVFARSDARVPITIDPAARRLVLDSAAVTAQDIDHAWADWMLLGDNRKYPPAFTSAGGDDHGGALYIPAYNLLENDWRVGPMESAHDLTITGKLFVRGGGVPVFNTLGTYQINVNCPVPVQAQGIATSGGAGATAAEGWAYGSRTLTSTDCPTASAIADAVWSRDISNATAR